MRTGLFFHPLAEMGHTNPNTPSATEDDESWRHCRDRTTLGAMAGMGAILARDVYSFLAKQIGFSKHYAWNVVAEFFLRGKEVYTVLGAVLGFLADLAAGSPARCLVCLFPALDPQQKPGDQRRWFWDLAWLSPFRHHVP